MHLWREALLVTLALALALAAGGSVNAAEDAATAGERLLAAYPDHLVAVDGNWLVWKDGTRMAIDDGLGAKRPEALLARPDLKDMFHWPYSSVRHAVSPDRDADPGRVRNQAFFDKMYGDCSSGEVLKNLTEIVWLPRKARQPLKVSRINNVAGRLEEVSRELDRLPARFDPYLFPAAGTFNCRRIAGTSRQSAHGAGIAIDIALKLADYWRWAKPDAEGRYRHRNRIPPEIVGTFERHGFIWGGRWYHYDTMHFEYRPELIGRR